MQRPRVSRSMKSVLGSMARWSTVLASRPLIACERFEGGRLKTSEGDLMPLSASGMFSAGDIRANENIELTSLHTLFCTRAQLLVQLRLQVQTQHSLTSKSSSRLEPSSSPRFNRSTYNEWLPAALLGRGAIDRYRGYDPSVNPSDANEFSTAGFRLAIFILQNDLEFLGNDGLPVRDGVRERCVLQSRACSGARYRWLAESTLHRLSRLK